MVGSLLLRGLLAGLVAGLAAGAFAFVAGEPRLEAAIALEGHAPGPVGRDAQRVGLVLATALHGAAVGGLFAIAYAVSRGRIGPRTGPALSLTLAGALFVAVVLVPFLKYPANPPGVGDPDSVGSRTALYLTMVATCLLALLAAVRVARTAVSRGHPSVASAAGVATFVATAGIAAMVLPEANQVPAGFPADLLWDFRLASVGTQLVLWAVLAGVFARTVRGSA